jgi:hypothetical protein
VPSGETAKPEITTTTTTAAAEKLVAELPRAVTATADRKENACRPQRRHRASAAGQKNRNARKRRGRRISATIAAATAITSMAICSTAPNRRHTVPPKDSPG